MTKTSKGKKPSLVVLHSSGTRQPFLRGMVTHDLVQRGVPFDDAYAVARAVRDSLSDRSEIETAELRRVIESQLAASVPDVLPDDLALAAPAPPTLTVSYGGEAQPFSRGLLARSLVAAGLDLDRAYALVLRFQQELHEEHVEAIDARELAQRMGDLLEREEGAEAAARYRLIRRIQRLPKPLILYCGGASGTGKSTLALELAPLLRIFRINATDTIRQVMRMIFSREILPSLHRSSFEPDAALGDLSLADREGRDMRIVAFEQQATQIAVGVRAVVERCLAENVSTIVEGVHLLPSMLPFRDLEGAAYQQMVLLTTLDEEVHRSHFMARAALRDRPPEHYLQNFAAIRLQQEYLLELADEHDVPLLDSRDRETMVSQALRIFTGSLQRQLPWLAAPEARPTDRLRNVLLVVDGLPDRPVRGLGGRTPLQAAETPHLDRLAREGRVGLADPVGPGVVPDTASGNLSLFGQAPASMNRGPIEAIGAGFELDERDIALRGNLATLDAEGRIVDRRAGRIREDAALFAQALDHLELPDFPEVEVLVRAGTEHRLALVLRGPGLSSAIAGSDPGDAAPAGQPLLPRPIDPKDEDAVRTAAVLAQFEERAREVLASDPTNQRRRECRCPSVDAVLTRGAGRIHTLQPIVAGDRGLRLACVGGDRTVLGIARMLGGETVSRPEMTANLDTDLRAKFDAALDALAEHDLVVLHVKGADIAAHDSRADLKVAFLEKLDRELGRFLERLGGDVRLAVASDHTTVSETGQHGADPVPVLLWGPGIEADDVERFDEASARSGSLERFPLRLLLQRLLESPAVVV